MEQAEMLGGCVCGEIRYRLSCKPTHSTVCHCPDCRRACGAQAVAWVTLPSDDFAFVRGEPTRFRSSPQVERTFCARCGTSLTYQSDDRKHEIDVTTGSLDDPEAFPPTEQVFAEHKLSWVKT